MPKTNVKLSLVGEDGNAFAILGRAQKALRGAGQEELFLPFQEEATSGDYDKLLRTCIEWFDTTGDDEFDPDFGVDDLVWDEDA